MSRADGRKLALCWLRRCILVASLAALPAALLAQNQNFTGHVADVTGAVLPKAKITVRNQETGVETTTMTTDAGDYTVPYLKPGLYSVSAEAKGFKKEIKTDITLEAGQSAVVNLTLEVGSITQTVSVKADAPMLDAGKADRGEVIENTRITELPLNGRNPFMLSILSAGVVWDGHPQWQRPFDNDVWNFLNINGGGNGSNEILLDGVANEATATNSSTNAKMAYVAPDDSVQEFKIVTNPYDAQYGRMKGGAVDMALKSGTNSLHGDVYEFARRSWLDANTWQNDYYLAENPKNSQFAKAKHTLDQYGTELDGPVLIPKVYDGRNKSFFLMQYENWNEVAPNTITGSVPEPQWLTGNFSNLTYWTGNAYAPITIYDPTILHADGSRAPFPNNQIPASRLNPTALKLLSFYPAPNVTPPPGSTPYQNNYVVPNPETDRYRNALGKWDQNFSSRDHFSLRYGFWERYEVDAGASGGLPGAAAYGEYPLGEHSHTFATEWTHTFAPNLLFDFRAAAIRRVDFDYQGPAGFNDTSLGWPSSMVSQLGYEGSHFPSITVSEFARMGNAGASIIPANSLNLLPSLAWIKGKHSIHIGLDWRILQIATSSAMGGPSFNVDRTWTQQYYNTSTPNSGNSIASLLLGTFTSGSTTYTAASLWSQHYYAPFIQDDWKVTRKLTLNLGLRYDLNGGQVERHNEGNYAFNTTAVSPVTSQIDRALMPNGEPVIGGVTFLGVDGNPRTLYSLSKLNIQPRFGFAYALNERTVMRGGIGELFENPTAGADSLGFSSTTQYVGSLDGGKTPLGNISDPFSIVVQPTGSSLGLLTGLGTGPYFQNPHFTIPNVWTFSFGFERQFFKNDILDVSYVGSRSYNVETSDNINPWNADAVARCNVQMGGNHHLCDDASLGGYVPNPFFHVPAFQGTGYYSSPTIQALNFTRPFPAFGNITEYQINGGESWYNSLQVSGTHRWSNSFTLHGTWTWSKTMDSGGWADTTYRIPSRTIDANDRTHRITLSGVYLLPVGRGRQFLSNSYRVVDWALGGWELSAIGVLETGVPWSAPGGYDYVHNASVPESFTPDGNIRLVAPCVWTTNPETGAISPTAFATAYGCTQPDFIQIPNYGAHYNVTYTGIRQLPFRQFDANLSKNFAILENMKLQLRLEAFNVLNHALFQNGFFTTMNADFGTIGRVTGGGQSNLPREVQLAAKLMW